MVVYTVQRMYPILRSGDITRDGLHWERRTRWTSGRHLWMVRLMVRLMIQTIQAVQTIQVVQTAQTAQAAQRPQMAQWISLGQTRV